MIDLKKSVFCSFAASLLLFSGAPLSAQFVHSVVNSWAGWPNVWLVAAGSGEVLGTNGSQTFRWDSSTPLGSWVATAAPPVSINSSTRATTRGAGTAVMWDGSQLFEWSGTQWSGVNWSGTAPSATISFSIAGMPNGDVLLFGGWNTAATNETWRLDANNVWTQLNPTVSPSPRLSSAMGYDSASGNVVIFGGSGASSALQDTWEFDGSTWLQTSAGGPAARWGGGLAYRPSTQTMTLIGGSASVSQAWNYVSGVWIPITSTYSGDLSRCYNAAVHPVTDEIIATGQTSGSAMTVTGRLSGHENVGAGCICNGQTSPFEAIGVGATNIGLTFTLTFANYEVGNPLWAIWDVLPIATPVQIPGLPVGCFANIPGIVDSSLVSAAPPASPAPNYFLAIPNSTALIGVRIVYQGLQLNLSPFLGCTSSAVDMRIGR